MGDSEKLIRQIGNYSNDSPSRAEQQEQDKKFTHARLEGKGLRALYDGILQYKQGYEDLIRQNYPAESLDDSKLNNRRFFARNSQNL